MASAATRSPIAMNVLEGVFIKVLSKWNRGAMILTEINRKFQIHSATEGTPA